MTVRPTETITPTLTKIHRTPPKIYSRSPPMTIHQTPTTTIHPSPPSTSPLTTIHPSPPPTTTCSTSAPITIYVQQKQHEVQQQILLAFVRLFVHLPRDVCNDI